MDGKVTYSKWFDIQRGVIQGDIISPILFILALDQLVQHHDKGGQGVSVGTINELRVLGYADDAAMAEATVEAMSQRLTRFANASSEHADMKVKPAKTFTQIIQRQDAVDKATVTEIMQKEKKYKFKCPFADEGCNARFKTKNGMMIHRATCDCGYSTTEKKFVVGDIVQVFGKASRKLYKVRWKNYPDPEDDSWESEKMLLQDGCREVIDNFWERSGKCRTLDFYPDPDGLNRCWMCGWICKKNNDVRYLKTHIKRMKHRWNKSRTHLTAKRDVRKDKLAERQNQLMRVYWGDSPLDNRWQAEYLGSIFQADGDQIPDIKRRVAMAVARAGKLRNIWAATELTLKLKMRLYKSACCSILTYGSEAWVLNEAACKIINGANASMLSHITGLSRHTEASSRSTTFNLVKWIRARRLKWVGHILRMDDNRLVKKALLHIYNNPQQGDILMDTSADSWPLLQEQAQDRDAWRKRVKQIAASCTHNWQTMSSSLTSTLRAKLIISKTRFHLRCTALKAKLPVVKKKAAKMSDAKAREAFYRKHDAKYEKHLARENFFIPTWTKAKQQVFSSSSSSASSSEDEHSDIWAAAADPAEYADCDSSVTNSTAGGGMRGDEKSTRVLWAAAAAVPADYADCGCSTNSNCSVDSLNLIFEPPAILGHHNNHDIPTTDTDTTLLNFTL